MIIIDNNDIDIRLSPKCSNDAHTISKITNMLDFYGKGVIEGLNVNYDDVTKDGTISPGIAIVDYHLIYMNQEVSFNLDDEMDKFLYDENGNQIYNSLEEALQNTDFVYLCLYYQYIEYDENDPSLSENNFAYYTVVRDEDIDINDSKYCILYLWDVQVT